MVDNKYLIEGMTIYTPLTQEFLLERGYCCNNGCENCPYNYKKEITEKTTLVPENLLEKQIPSNWPFLY